MRKLLVVILLFAGGLTSYVRSQDIRAAFMSAPDDVLPLLTHNMRADLLDYVDAGMKAEVNNELSGVSRLDTLSGDFLSLSSTASTIVQMKLLPYGDSSLICVIKSVKAEAEDSRMAFYNMSWERMDDEGLFQEPEIKDFFISHESAHEYMDKCDMYLVSLKLGSADNCLVAEYTMPYYMSEEDSAIVKPLLRRLKYIWISGSFRPE